MPRLRGCRGRNAYLFATSAQRSRPFPCLRYGLSVPDDGDPGPSELALVVALQSCLRSQAVPDCHRRLHSLQRLTSWRSCDPLSFAFCAEVCHWCAIHAPVARMYSPCAGIPLYHYDRECFAGQNTMP
eukprot:scaffold1941_cov377-Prasinococcus_capsulatus_cf.AAC.4